MCLQLQATMMIDAARNSKQRPLDPPDRRPYQSARKRDNRPGMRRSAFKSFSRSRLLAAAKQWGSGAVAPSAARLQRLELGDRVALGQPAQVLQQLAVQVAGRQRRLRRARIARIAGSLGGPRERLRPREPARVSRRGARA